MLEELHISNLALIEDTNITIDSKYIALVGETGAGKTLIVDSLSLLKGDKFDSSLIRDKNKKVIISGLFMLDEHFIKNHKEINEFISDDNTVILKRIISTDKTSKYYINDELLTLNKYKEVTSYFLDIHSQGENSMLLDENNHLFYLDEYIKKDIDKIKNEYVKLYKTYLDDNKELEKMIEDNSSIDEEYLTFQINEIKKYKLQENEIEDLLQEEKTLKNYEKLIEIYSNYLSIKDKSSLDETLSQMLSSLRFFKETSLNKEAINLSENISSLIDSMDEFEDAISSLDIDQNRIEYVNERLFNLKGLMRKYGSSTKDILDKLNDFESKLSLAKDFTYLKEELNKKIEDDYNKAYLKAKELSSLRKKYAVKLEKEISSTMSELGLLKDGFKVDFEEGKLSINGIDKVSYKVCLNDGMPFSSLVKASSGGENSRLMLSLKCVLNALDPYQLLVFDEIDTGVSGKIASLVGKLIKKISDSSQVIVISHLPQVVSSSLRAYEVYKKSEKDKTISYVKELDENGKINAVAKLLSSSKVSDEAILQAKKLIDEYK